MLWLPRKLLRSRQNGSCKQFVRGASYLGRRASLPAVKPRQLPQRYVNAKRSFPNDRSASQLSLITHIAARNPNADILGVIEHVMRRRRRMLIESKLSFENAVFRRVPAGEIGVRAASQHHAVLEHNDTPNRPIHTIKTPRPKSIKSRRHSNSS